MINRVFIALVEKLEKLDHQNSEIKVTIVVLGEDGTPRNYSFDMDDPKNNAGGCFARIFRSDYKEEIRNYFGAYGPEISYGDLNNYRHGVYALKMIDAATEKLRQKRGYAPDPADEIGRWLEACKIEKVFMRPLNSKHSEWLHHGDWKQLEIGEFVNQVRACLTTNVNQIAA